MIYNGGINALLKLQNYLEFTMTNCIFEYNFTNGKLIHIDSIIASFYPANYENQESVPDKMTHIKFEGCEFRNNGSDLGSLINIEF